MTTLCYACTLCDFYKIRSISLLVFLSTQRGGNASRGIYRPKIIRDVENRRGILSFRTKKKLEQQHSCYLLQKILKTFRVDKYLTLNYRELYVNFRTRIDDDNENINVHKLIMNLRIIYGNSR